MRIERLYLDGFGHYAEREIGPFDASLSVVHGDNEAGKSTLLAFMRAVIFGFPQRLGAQHYPPLRGGNHGGRVALRLNDNRVYTVQRYQGRRGGPSEVRDAAGQVLGESAFSGLIGHASETLFRDAFTFDLDDLPSFDAASGDLGGLLYGVSVGAERLPQSLTRLERRINDLFLQGGSNQKVAGLLRGLEETDARLREVDAQAAEYHCLTERREVIERELAALSERHQEAVRTHQALERRYRAWTDWTLLRALDQQLASMEDTTGFPMDGLSRLEQAERDLQVAESDRDEAAEELEAIRLEVKRDVPDVALLDAADDVEALRRRRGAMDDSLRDLPQRHGDLQRREHDLRRRLTDLGPGWDESRLFEFDLSITRRAEIEGWERRLDEARDALRDRTREQADARNALERAAVVLREADAERARLDAAPDEDAIRERASRLRQVRLAHSDHERARQRLSDLEAQARSEPAQPVSAAPAMRQLPTLLLVALGASLAAAGGWLVAGPVGAGAGGALGGTLGAFLGYVLNKQHTPAGVQSGPRAIDGLIRDSQQDVVATERALRVAAGGSLSDGDRLPDATAIEAAEAALEADRPRAVERAKAARVAVDAAREHDRARQQLEEMARAQDAASRHQDALQEEWREWLSRIGLPADLTPRTASAVLAAVEAARDYAEEVRDWRHRVDAIQHDIAEDRASVEPLARRIDIDRDLADDRAVVNAADAIIARFDIAREERVRRGQAFETMQERERAHQRAVTRTDEARTALTALLEAGGVSDPEDFRRRAHVDKERGEVGAERRECELRLRQIVGPDDEALDILDAELDDTTQDELLGAVEAAESVRAETQEQRDALLDERGRIRTEIERLHSDETASEARARAAMLETELHETAREWSSLVVARTLLQHVRERYERERQPAVIQHAEQYFRTLTGGRYVRLYRPIGASASDITVEEHDGTTKVPGQLSRGTREQLYLALRLGAIQEAVGDSEPLPVIVDEVMVNFDETRARRAAEAFVQLSQHTQVIVFTCHPWVMRLFEETAGKVRMIPLGE